MAITQTYVDYGTGNDYNGASFTDGAFTVADMTLTKVGAFVKSKVNHWLYLTDNGSGQVTAGYYKIASVTSANAVVLATSPKSGATDPTDVKCTQATGTTLLPFRSVQGALDIITRDATNGDQINVQSGTTQTLSAALTLATYGTPTATAPLVIRGYTAAANDGGVGVISGAGSYNFYTTTYSYVHLRDLHITNGSTGTFVDVQTGGSVVNCEIDTAVNGVQGRANTVIAHCYVHDCTGIGIIAGSTAVFIFNNYLVNGSVKKFTYGIRSNSTPAFIGGNVIKLDGSSIGIQWNFCTVYCLNNTIFSAAGTGTGLDINDTAYGACLNNVVEGFSGTGGKGITTHANSMLIALGYNAYYNNATPSAYSGKVWNDYTASDIALGASPFTNPSGGDFSVSTALKALGFPASFLGASTNTYIDIGAAQRQEPAGGAVSISPSLGSVGAA